MEPQKSIKLSFIINHHPNNKGGDKESFHFALFLDDRISVVKIIPKKEQRMETFTDVEDLKSRGKALGLTSEDLNYASRILSRV